MGLANNVGSFHKENVLREADPTKDFVSGTTPLVTYLPSQDLTEGWSLIVAISNRTFSITRNAADSVVASTGTWHFVNGGFTAGDAGATMTIANASNSGNNGAKTILTVVDGTHVTTATTSLVNETFGPTVTATVADLPVQGTLTVGASNDYVRTNFAALNQNPSAGHWGDISSGFTGPTIPAITTAVVIPLQAYPFVFRDAKVTITPTSGASLVSMFFAAKGNK
jgi:hypothetical protein